MCESEESRTFHCLSSSVLSKKKTYNTSISAFDTKVYERVYISPLIIFVLLFKNGKKRLYPYGSLSFNVRIKGFSAEANELEISPTDGFMKNHQINKL